MRKLGLFIPTILAVLFAVMILGAELASAQTYGSNGQWSYFSNAQGEFWCYTNGNVTFRSTTGAVAITTPSDPGYIQCPIVAAVATYSAPVAVSAPVTYSAPAVQQPVVVQPIVVDPCASAYGGGYSAGIVNPFGYGYNNAFGYRAFNYGGMGNGCGYAQPYVNPFPFSTCNFPGSCGGGRPPHHDHDCVPSTTVKCH